MRIQISMLTIRKKKSSKSGGGGLLDMTLLDEDHIKIKLGFLNFI